MVKTLYESLKNKYESKEIIFTGYLSNKETLENIRNATCVVTANKLYEGQPNLLSEASLFKVPSIFPDSGGIKEFFQMIQNWYLNNIITLI